MSELPSTSPGPSSGALRPSKGRHVLLSLLIFLGGAACGAGVATHLIVRSLHQPGQHPEGLSEHITARLAHVLDLTDAQRQQVRQIIARRHDALMDIRRDIQPRVEVELSTLESELDAVLSEDQREKWHEHVEKFRAHWLPPVPAKMSED